MMHLPTSLYRAAQVRELDRIAIDRYGIPGIELMERAGLAAWQELQAEWPQARAIAVVCGGGNNAGDGYILARLALEHDCRVRVLTLVEPARLKGDAASAAQRLRALAEICEPFTPADLDCADVIVDAVLGTGLDRELEDAYADAILAINSCGKPVLAVDIPSGLHADTGRIMGAAVRADRTVSFIGLKQGMFTGQGPACSGRLVFSDLDVPSAVYAQVAPACTRIDLESQAKLLPPRSRAAHKGQHGHTLVVGGDLGYAGAARMAGEAAARVGSGLVTVASRPAHASTIPLAVPELMACGIELPADLAPLLARATVVAAGPGLGQAEWGMALLARILDSDLPLVLDADGLNLLATEPGHSGRWVLTPHPGEAARLLNLSAGDIERDRFSAVTRLQERYGGVIVLKGSGTLICGPDGGIAVCCGGNPGMASGGMGDVLTGVIAGLLAQGLKPGDAARLGVCIHAAAGDRAAQQGERGMLASDLMPWIRHLANTVPAG